ncbi:MAG: Gfo/Idh/MocA family oxidoreductase [Anaerolineae bacterium]|nr:Gfo/Idh/MocA family oxidoreductase [Anaerolineae bacterium]
MKILIAGLGSIGRRHFRNLVALGEKDIVLYRTHKATLPDDELAGYPVETDLVEALKKHRPQAVIVANPTALHMEVAIPAAQAGCAVLLEKPISEDLSRVDELRSAAKKNGNRILVGFQFRFHPTLNRAKELIEAGALGKILTVHAHWGEYLPNWHPWEDYRASYAARDDLGGGVVRTLTHPLDYLRFLLGEVVSLHALSGHVSPLELSGVEDVAEIGLKFASGAIGGVHVNYFQRPAVHRLEIVGAAGTLRWDNADGTLIHFQMPDSFGGTYPQPAAAIETHYPLPDGFERNQLFVAQTQHFLKVAAGESAPICTLEDGVRALEMALAARSPKSSA